MKAYKGGKSSGGNQHIDSNLLRVIQQIEKETGHTVKANESETKYSEMLLDLIKPLHGSFFRKEELQSLLDLASIAWNVANMKTLMPQAYKTMLEGTKEDFGIDKESISMLEKMIQHKLKKYGQEEMFIHKADVNFSPDGQLFVTATAKPMEAFLADSMAENEDADVDIENFKPGYVNRSAISTSPSPAFYEWMKKAEDDYMPAEIKEASIYLIDEMYSPKEIEEWVKKNYEMIFNKQLEIYIEQESLRPKKKSYKLFREWFDVSYHSTVFDLKDYPVDK